MLILEKIFTVTSYTSFSLIIEKKPDQVCENFTYFSCFCNNTIMFIALFMLALVLFIFYHVHWKRRGLPPGPIPIPLFGNTLEIGRYPPGYEAFKRWTKLFGPIYTV